MFGYRPSPPDPRDYTLRSYAWPILPLSYTCPDFGRVPVLHQGSRPSCVGHACTSLKIWQECRERGEPVIWSREYLYSRCKERDGIPDVPGTYPRVAMDLLRELGICSEELCPYQKQDRAIVLTEEMDQAAHPQRIATYARVLDVRAMQVALRAHGPVVIGIPVFANWFTSNVETTGNIPLPQGNEQGGHAVLVYGWETFQDGLYFRFRNSWGELWGLGGNGMLSADYPNLFQDAWLSVDTGTQGRIVRGE